MIRCERRAELDIETPHLCATVRTEGYVSGIKSRSFVDKRTGATDLGSGLHIMDFLLVPGWGDAEPNRIYDGNLPKRVVEGPQICTRARQLDYEVIQSEAFWLCGSGLRLRMWLKVFRPGRGGNRHCYFYRTRGTYFRANGFIVSTTRIVCSTGSTCPATCTTRAETPLHGFT